MFNKANPKILGIAFVVLLALVLIVQYTGSQRGERSFKSELIPFTADEINEVQIAPDNSDSYSLVKEGDSWKVRQGNRLYTANENRVSQVLDQLANLKVNQVVATSPDNWGQYQVSDSLATQVEVNAGDESVGLRIGKLNFDRRTRSAVSYVRQAGDDNVYGVDGFLKMTFGRDVNAYRQRALVSLSGGATLSKISFAHPADSSFVLEKNNNQWMIEGRVADSASVAGYINKIKNLKGSTFADVEEPDMSNPMHKVSIEGEQQIAVSVKQIDGEWIIHSSLTPDAYFLDSQGTLRRKLFVSKRKLLQ